MERQSPVGTTTKLYALNMHILATIKEQQLGACCLTGALTTLVIVGIDTFASMVQAVDIQCQLLTLSVDGSTTSNADILGPIGHQQRHRGIIVSCIAGLSYTDRLIIIRISATQKCSAFLKIQLYARAQHYTASKIDALSKHHTATTFLIDIIDGLLQLTGTKSLAVCRNL